MLRPDDRKPVFFPYILLTIVFSPCALYLHFHKHSFPFSFSCANFFHRLNLQWDKIEDSQYIQWYNTNMVTISNAKMRLYVRCELYTKYTFIRVKERERFSPSMALSVWQICFCFNGYDIGNDAIEVLAYDECHILISTWFNSWIHWDNTYVLDQYVVASLLCFVWTIQFLDFAIHSGVCIYAINYNIVYVYSS